MSVNPIFANNMKQLKISCPQIYEKIHNCKNESWIEIQKNNNFIVKKRGRVLNAYDIQSPEKEAEAIGKQKIYTKDTCTVIVGMGLGHIVNSILRNGEKGHKVIVVEPVTQFIKESFSRYNLSDYISKGHLCFVQEKEEVAMIITEMDAVFVIQDWYLIADKYVMLCEEYAEILPYTIEVINQERCNTGTVMGAGSTIAENDIKNLPYCIRHRGVNELKDLFKGKPAITVNTGPSLEKNIYLLRDIQDKVIIIAVAQALRVLLAYDITPDFICTVDYGEVNYEHFKGLMNVSVPLVALNRTYAPILEEWQGPKFITVSINPGFENTTAGLLYEKGAIEAGGSVSHLAFGLAYHMGCSPIATVGLDLAYSADLKSHIPQVDAGGKCTVDEAGQLHWDIKDPRSTLKGKELSMGSLNYVPGYFGEMVPTNIGLASFITSFETIYENIHKKDKDQILIDATEGGAKIKGSVLMTLKKYIDTYLKKDINKSVLNPLLTYVTNYEYNITLAIELIKDDIKLLDGIIENASKGIAEAEKMLDKDISKEDFLSASANNERHANKAHELAKKNALMGVAIYKASRKIFSKEFIIDKVNDKEFKNSKEKRKFAENHMFKTFPDLKKGVDKSIMILTSAQEAAEKFKPMYENVLHLFEKYLRTKDGSLLQKNINEVVDLSDVDKYFESGNWAHPYVDTRNLPYSKESFPVLEKAIKMKEESIKNAKAEAKKERRQDRLDYNFYVEEAQKIGREKKDFKAAIKLLHKAETLFPKKFDARWGLASAYFHSRETAKGNLQKSLTYFKELYEDFKDMPRVKFEYAVVLLEKDLAVALDMLEEVMKESNEFLHFQKDMGDLYFKSKLWQKAQDKYEAYKKIYPADYSINENLMSCYRKTGDIKKLNKMVK
jgi:hypothetical protein